MTDVVVGNEIHFLVFHTAPQMSDKQIGQPLDYSAVIVKRQLYVARIDQLHQLEIDLTSRFGYVIEH
jgi:hypothetical protein